MADSIGAMSSSGSGGITGQLDVQWIVEQMIYAKQQPIRAMEVEQFWYEAKIEAFQELNTKVSTVESSLYDLNKAGFDSMSVVSDDETLLTATTSTTANEGNYFVIVRQLAKAQSDMSDGIASADTALSVGTFTISPTDGGDDIDISTSGKTITELKDEINSATDDFSATLIFDGTDYHLQVTAGETGAENGFTITDTGVGTNMTNKITAQDALINVNTELEADAISRASNTISDVIGGVTLNLKDADATKTIKVTVANDTSGFREKVDAFAEAFNDLADYLNAQFEYDTENERAGVLSGESAALKVQRELYSVVSKRVGGASDTEDYKSFAVIGIELDVSGKITINDSKFEDAIVNHLDAVERIFKDIGTSTYSEVSYIGRSSNTTAGTFDINITQVAEKASVTGDVDITGGSPFTGTETLTITYGGTDYTVGLDGSTTSMTLDDVVNAVNNGLSGTSVTATSSGNRLVIETNAYGSSETVSVSSTGTGIFTSSQSDTGQNVEGSFTDSEGNVDNVVGSGQKLTSFDGLIAMISSTTTGDKGDIYLTTGVGESLRTAMSELSFPFTGIISKSIETYDTQLDNIDKKISDINRNLAMEEDILIAQFSQANAALAELEFLKMTFDDA